MTGAEHTHLGVRLPSLTVRVRGADEWLQVKTKEEKWSRSRLSRSRYSRTAAKPCLPSRVPAWF